MGMCSAKKEKKMDITEQNDISSKQTCQQDQAQDIQRMIKSERVIKTNLLSAQTPRKQQQQKIAGSPSTKAVKHMVWADQIIENSVNFRGTLKTFISIKNAQFSKYYSILNKEQSQCKIKLNEQMALVQHNLSGNKRVAELIKKNRENTNLVEEIVKSQLIHPNLIRIFEIFQDNTNYQIIHDFCNGGTLQQFLNIAVYTQQQAALTLKQIIEVIQYIHQYGYTHGFLSLQSFQKCNQSNSCYIKLTDFKPIYIKEAHATKDIMYYLPPEAIKIPDIYSNERDVWSIGVILYKMLSGQFPFKGNNLDEIYNSISIYSQTDNFDVQCLPPQSIGLIKQFLRINPKDRIKLNQALSNDFLKNFIQQSQQELDVIVKQLDNNHSLSFLQCCFLQFMISTFRQDQEQHLYQIFRQFDVNHDGKLSKQDLTQAYLSYCSNLQEVKEHVDAIFKGMDLNKNGEVDFQEFLIGVIDRNELITKDNLNEAFKILAAIDGHITLQKMCTLYVNKKQALKQSFLKFENNQITYKQFEDLMFDAL